MEPNSRRARDFLIPTALIALAAFPVLVGVARLLGLAIGKELVPGQARFAASPVPIVLHIVGATLFCVLGALQFSPGLRRRRRSLHRRLGWVLAPAGLVAALAGMWMSIVYPLGVDDGPLLRSVRLLAGGTMAVSLVIAVIAIGRRDVRAHGRWMIRAYALGVAAGTQALLLVPLALLGHPTQTERSYALFMAAGWIINLVVAESAIRAPRIMSTPPSTSTSRT